MKTKTRKKPLGQKLKDRESKTIARGTKTI